MILTHHMMGWLVLAVLCQPVWSAVKVVQPYRVVSTDGTAKIRCFVQPQPAYHQQTRSHGEQSPPYPYPDPEEFRVTLLRSLHGTRELCSAMVNFTGPQRAAGVKKEGEVQCAAQVSAGAVEVTLSGLKAADTDIYRCDIRIFYPPPYLRHTGNGTLVHVLESCPEQEREGHVARRRDEGEDDESDEAAAPVSVPVVVLVLLVISVLVIIIYFQALQCERGRREVVRTVPGGAHKVVAVSISHENIQ